MSTGGSRKRRKTEINLSDIDEEATFILDADCSIPEHWLHNALKAILCTIDICIVPPSTTAQPHRRDPGLASRLKGTDIILLPILVDDKRWLLASIDQNGDGPTVTNM